MDFELYVSKILLVSLGVVEKKCYDAFNYGRKQEALRLLKQVNDPRTVKSKNNFTLLHCAAYHGWLDVVKEMITEIRFNPDCEDKDGNTPLSKARSNGKLMVVDYLETFIGEFVVYSVYIFHVREYASEKIWPRTFSVATNGLISANVYR